MINFSTAAGSDLMSALKARIDIGGAAAYVQFYDGTRPATGATPGGSLVVTAPLAYPCGSINGSGHLVFGAGANGLVLVSATPAWARIRTSADAFVADCNCRLIGAAPSSDPEEIVIDAPAIVAGAYVAIAGGTIQAPA